MDETTQQANSFGFITESQLMLLTGVTQTTLVRWRSTKRGPAHVVAGNSILYSTESVKQWLDGLSKPAAPTPMHGGKRTSRAPLL